MTTPFRWAIAGFGWVARDHFTPALAEIGHELIAVADPVPAARTAAPAPAYASLDALLTRHRPDALYVATPNHLHRAPALAAAAAGIPMLCEKPLAATLADAEAIASALPTGGTAFDQRHHPVHTSMARLIAEGAIGPVTAIRIVYCCWVGPDWSPARGGAQTENANWRADPAQAGGGAVIDLAPHGIDLVHLLTREPLARLHVALQRRVHAYAVEDGGMLTGTTASGILFQAHVAYNTPEALPRRRLEVMGTKGMLTATDSMGQTATGTLALIDAHGRATDRTPPLRSPFAAQAEAFARHVRGEPAGFDMARDLAAFRLLDAAYRRALECR